LDVFERVFEAGEVRQGLGQLARRRADGMGVAVVQPRQDVAALHVDDLGAASTVLEHAGIVADRENAVCLDGDGLGDRELFVGGQHFGVMKNDVGRFGFLGGFHDGARFEQSPHREHAEQGDSEDQGTFHRRPPRQWDVRIVAARKAIDKRQPLLSEPRPSGRGVRNVGMRGRRGRCKP
jgi:hypothetical protein